MGCYWIKNGLKWVWRRRCRVWRPVRLSVARNRVQSGWKMGWKMGFNGFGVSYRLEPKTGRQQQQQKQRKKKKKPAVSDRTRNRVEEALGEEIKKKNPVKPLWWFSPQTGIVGGGKGVRWLVGWSVGRLVGWFVVVNGTTMDGVRR